MILGLLLILGSARANDIKPTLTRQMHAAADYLHAQIGTDGRMIYRRDARTGQEMPGRYNLLRHAGSLLVLGQYHAIHPADATQRRAALSALDYLRRCCLSPSQPGAADQTIWSDPALVGGRRSYPLAKLGGAALTLAAMAQWRQLLPDQVDLTPMQALGRFIVSMQQSDGRFRSLHAHQAGQHDPQWASLYYPGQASLSLILLYEQDGDIRWLKTAIDGLMALARERESQPVPPPDHWAMLATARLAHLTPSVLNSALPNGLSWSPEAGKTAVAPVLLEHVLSIAKVMLGEQTDAHDCRRGSFGRDGRSTPTAVRLEGLLAVLEQLPAGRERIRIEASVHAGMQFLSSAQRTTGPAQGGFSRVSAICASDDPRAHEVRIDYVQHALAALLGYLSMATGR